MSAALKEADSFGLPPAGMGHNSPPAWDMEPVKSRLTSLLAERDKVAEVGALWRDKRPVIEDEDQAGKAANLIALARGVNERIDAEREAEKRPHLDANKMIEGTFKVWLTPLADTLSDVGSKLDKWKAKQREAARQEQARLAEEARKLAAEAHTREDQERAAQMASRSAELAKPVQTRTEAGVVASERQGWDFEITDAAVLPREYLSPDEKKIKAAIKAAGKNAGALAIPGVTITEKFSTIVRK